MKRDSIHVDGLDIPLLSVRVLVVGSGAASLNAAVHLKRFGIDDLLLLTEGLGLGTSAQAGSDKQTYYRLHPAGAAPDSVRAMAEDLYGGGCMHGDIALVEAALSAREFYHLVELGVPFPHDRYGDYAGFRTDHDTHSRGTSSGPGTSITMVEALLRETRNLGIPVMERAGVIEILTVPWDSGRRVAGCLAMRLDRVTEADFGLVLVSAPYIVWGTGGPGALYADSVYPHSQEGSTGTALSCGAVAHNLGESQFGIAATPVRWNLSGSYQQALPRYFSTDRSGRDEREFLADYFPSWEALMEAQFLKGYQWPFDVRRVAGYGSSSIDCLVFHERNIRGRRVFLDYRSNPFHPGGEFAFQKLPAAAREYLEKSGAVGDLPVDRLRRMNPPALDLFMKNGIDLGKEPLEICVAHQHSNGGLRGSPWWESSVRNLFPVGEVCGTHGLYRPGGSALNAGQVGSLRAAQMIAHRCAAGREEQFGDEPSPAAGAVARRLEEFARLWTGPVCCEPTAERRAIQGRMSRVMGIFRSLGAVRAALAENDAARATHSRSGIRERPHLYYFLKNGDLLVAERLWLYSAAGTLSLLKGGRGSYLMGEPEDIFVSDAAGCVKEIRVRLDDGSSAGSILEVWCGAGDAVEDRLVPVHPIPEPSGWFERTWAEFREGEIFRESEV